MTISDLIRLLETALSNLGERREAAVRIGDISRIQAIDFEVQATQATLNTLSTLVE